MKEILANWGDSIKSQETFRNRYLLLIIKYHVVPLSLPVFVLKIFVFKVLPIHLSCNQDFFPWGPKFGSRGPITKNYLEITLSERKLVKKGSQIFNKNMFKIIWLFICSSAFYGSDKLQTPNIVMEEMGDMKICGR